jgi:ubiquinone biosynthesis protein COQ4
MNISLLTILSILHLKLEYLLQGSEFMATSQTDYTFIAPRMDFTGAWRALRALMNNREDTTQVFTIMRALTGKSLWKQYQRFAKTTVGKRILDEKIDLLDTLANREALAKLPEGSLGRVYLNFMINECITAEGLVEVSAEAYEKIDHEELAHYTMRTREMHDLWHVVSGYGRDGLGEVCIVAFSYPQTKSLGFGAIAAMGAYTFARQFPKQGVLKAVWQAYRAGRNAAWLPGQDWEHLLTQPIEDVRAQLNITDPSHYLAAADISAQLMPEPVTTKAEPDQAIAA